ncbi:fungal protein [Schizosaccharomyces japonicus yFS275]|uniref:Fungal protein n=1 Tax=Schizosaccharomyces japonicus (strain yFS275 / FY16936) TaxID=402676 RepID=B6JVR8_SCHJY|nr:fungal protein [Schizosaccharomyces japonicus yFS275]EEB05469.1 fungal protein [Schizosaccharomyces japonicus yFS275]
MILSQLLLFFVACFSFVTRSRAEFTFLTPSDGSRWAISNTYSISWDNNTDVEFVNLALEYTDGDREVITQSGPIPTNQSHWRVQVKKKWLQGANNLTARIVAVPQQPNPTVQLGPTVLLAETFYFVWYVETSPAFQQNNMDKGIAIGLSVALLGCVGIVLAIHFTTQHLRKIRPYDDVIELR